MKKLLVSMLTAAVLAGAAAQSRAVTFAQFTQATSGNGFQWTASNVSDGTLTTTPTPLPIRFLYLNPLSGLNSGATTGTFYDANLTFTASADGTPAFASGSNFDQGLTSLSFSIIGTSGALAGKNLLSGTASIASLSVVAGGNSGGVQASDLGPTPAQQAIVDFTSDVIDLTGHNSDALGLAFTSLTPPGALSGPLFNEFIRSFTAAGTGTFSTSISTVPEPNTLALLLGTGIGGTLLFRRRRA